MTTHAHVVDVPPDVARISEGLRDTGYDFNTAVADIVDNSIAAGADRIDVRLAVDFTGELVLAVLDNGCGMDRPGLINAMRYGSKRRDSAKSLGKFGLGLKTASTAFCRRLSLISRSEGTEALRATWDLDLMAEKNSWTLQIAPPTHEEVEILNSVAGSSSGTAVIWESVDRLLESYKDPAAKPRKKALERLETKLREHFAVVYQRFLDPLDARERNLEIGVNGTPVLPWDPFLLTVTKAPVAEKNMTVKVAPDKEASFRVRAFILPRKEELADADVRNAARISNERQGVYVYRENRLIHGPDWMGMYKQEPHYSLLRVELSFGHELDDAFQVDIKKSRILLDEALFEWLRDKFLAGPRREAELRYRRGAASTATGASLLIHNAASNVIDQKAGALSKPSVSVIDAKTGQVQVENKAGSTKATLRIVAPEDAGSLNIITSPTLESGVLWEPTLREGGVIAVALNTGHPYYVKAYLPNKKNSAVVQALDYLLWALAVAEMDNIDDYNKDAFEEFRVQVSRNLKKLVIDLPDPPETDD